MALKIEKRYVIISKLRKSFDCGSGEIREVCIIGKGARGMELNTKAVSSREGAGARAGLGRLASASSTTLVETLVSCAILMLTVGGLLYGAVAAKYLLNSSANRAEVWNLITSRHEEISDWSEAYLATTMGAGTWTNVETSTNLLQQGLLQDSPLRNAIENRTTVISRLTTNFYRVQISVTYKQSKLGAVTTNIQMVNWIYFTPRY